MVFRVDSEVGPLRQVVLHRPGREISRLTRWNVKDLLFSEVPSAARAADEHDAFAESLRARGVRVHYFARLLAETLDGPEGRAFVLDRICTREMLGPSLVGPVRAHLDGLDSTSLAEQLVAGVLKSDLHPLRGPGSLRLATLCPDDFVLPPLPNHLFPRDSSCWIYGGVCLSRMAKPARRRESLHARAIYRYHPAFAAAGPTVYYGDDDGPHQPATIEGGDVHILGNGAVMIGMGERTSAMAVEILAGTLFEAGQAHVLIAVELPRSPAVIHLDTVLTMVDRSAFVAHRRLGDQARSWTLTPGGPGGLVVTPNRSLEESLSRALGRGVSMLWTGGGTNFLAVAPGVVYGYESNVTTNSMLRRHGIEVVPVAGRQLARGRGGPRCMSCPLEREPA